MPRNGKRGAARKPRGSGQDASHSSDDNDSVFNDNASVFSDESTLSALGNKLGGGSDSDPESDALTKEELVEESLREAMDMATEKAASHRVNGLGTIRNCLLKRQLVDFLEGRHATLADIFDRSLKRGKGKEQLLALNLACITSIQLEGDSEIYAALQPTLTTFMMDRTAVDAKVRAGCAQTLAFLTFLTCVPEDFKPVMLNLEKTWLATAETFDVATAALNGWALLATMMSPAKAYSMLETHLEDLMALMTSPDLDLRIAVGETLVTLYESIYDDEELCDEAYSLLEASAFDQLKDLATDSHKYRSKKDRKEQKSSFRDILKTIEGDEEYYEEVKFGRGEVLQVGSWCMKKQYDAFCKVLTSGTQMYLKENLLVREVFALGAPLIETEGRTKTSKSDRMGEFKACAKIRQLHRGKNRDKRMAV